MIQGKHLRARKSDDSDTFVGSIIDVAHIRTQKDAAVRVYTIILYLLGLMAKVK